MIKSGDSWMDHEIDGSRFARAKSLTALALCLLAAVTFAYVLAPAPAQARPKATGKKHPSCATFVNKSQIERALGGGAAIEFLGAQHLSEGQVGNYVGRISECGYGWENPPTGNPEPLANKVPAIWAIGWGLSAKDWAGTVAREKSDPSEGTGPWTFQTLRLGSGSKAFAVTSTGLNSPASYVYALTKNHDLLWIDVWPAKVSAISDLVQNVLTHNPTF
jgi:hypothetical protein